MTESAPTTREAVSSVALANHNISVNTVNLIDVILIHAKIMELVLSHSLTTFQHQNVNVPEIMVGQLVTLTYA